MLSVQNKLKNKLFNINETIYLDINNNIVQENDNNIKAVIPAVKIDSFGAASFKKEYNVKFAYVGGSMVGGISSVEMVKALVNNGALGMYGASGLSPQVIEEAIIQLKKDLGDKIFGSCLIHNPHDPAWEAKVIDIYLKHKVRVIEASAFMQLNLNLVRYRLNGLKRNPDGSIEAPNKIMAKVSRVELAKRFFSPAPEKLIKQALEKGLITEQEADLSQYIPMAQDLTAEADSGGHTDFRPALALWPAMINYAKTFSDKYKYQNPIRIGLAGGIGSPWAYLAAQEIGAAYMVTGSINQSCQESGLSLAGRKLLCKASQTDVLQAPAADMFELGAKVQVLRFGTLYAMRAQKLAETYKLYDSMDEIPKEERLALEEQIFRTPLKEIWEQTASFFAQREPAQIEKANKNEKYKMALVFRWYLGQASRWAINGTEDRKTDWQIFCGPAQGAFNEWVKGSYLEEAQNREVFTLALNLFYNAAVLKRYNFCKAFNIFNSAQSIEIKPQSLSDLKAYL